MVKWSSVPRAGVAFSLFLFVLFWFRICYGISIIEGDDDPPFFTDVDRLQIHGAS